MSKVYREAYEKAKKYPSILDEIKGIAYMNYDEATHNQEYKSQ